MGGTPATERTIKLHCATKLARLARVGCVIPLTHIPCLCRRSLTCPCTFSVYTKDTGSTKKSYELDLLREQKKHGVSIFSCGGWDVFSDVRVDIGGGYSTELQDVNNEFHQIKRKVSGAWVNWGMF